MNETESNDDKFPLAPFNLLTPFELSALAIMLSKGDDPARHLSDAATLWAKAFQYSEFLQDAFWGPNRPKIKSWSVHSLGAQDKWIDLDTACGKYALGREHLRDLLKENLPAQVFAYLWKPPLKSIRLPLTLLEEIEKLRVQKRKHRSQKAVKSK